MSEEKPRTACHLSSAPTLLQASGSSKHCDLTAARRSFMAGLATHRSAEPDTLVVRAGLEDRELLIADAPETYYVTDIIGAIPSCWCVCRASTGTPCVTCYQCHGTG